MTETRTTCPYCGVGCGVVARVEGEAVSVHGDETHPANLGRLCVKGSAWGKRRAYRGGFCARSLTALRWTGRRR